MAQYLKEHEFKHTKELPYICGVSGCTLRFRQAGRLSLHRKTHPEYMSKKYDYSLNMKQRTKIHRSSKRSVQTKEGTNLVDNFGCKVKNVPSDDKEGNQLLPSIEPLPGLWIFQKSLQHTSNSSTIGSFDTFKKICFPQNNEIDNTELKSSLKSLIKFLENITD